jgi:magnesium transporter
LFIVCGNPEEPDRGVVRVFSKDPDFLIVDCAVYEGGKRLPEHLPLGEAYERARRSPDGFVWIGLLEPTFEEFDEVTEVLDLPALAVEDAVHAHQRPKIERYDDLLFVVLISARYVDPDEVIEFGEVMLFVEDHVVVTVRHGQAAALAETRKDLEADGARLTWGPTSVLYAVMDRVVDEYEKVLVGLDNDIDEIEAQVFSGTRRNHAERIFKLKREVLDFRRAIRPLAHAITELDVKAVAEDHFRDVQDHLLRVAEHVESYEAILVSALNANLAQVGVQQNEDMRKISAWAGLITVPTMIAGIYGMNFDHMPELRWYFGYPLVLAFMSVVCFALYRNFKRSGWL